MLRMAPAVRTSPAMAVAATVTMVVQVKKLLAVVILDGSLMYWRGLLLHAR